MGSGINYPFYGYPAVYVDPDIVTLDVEPAAAELGSSVAYVSLSWSLSKAPTALKLDGVAIGLNETVMVEEGPFTTQQSWKLEMSDQFRTVNKKVTLPFLNKAYCGFAETAPIDSDGILALAASEFAVGLEFSATIGAQEISEVEFTLSSVSFTNPSGYTEKYTVLALNGPVPDPNGTFLEIF